MKYSVSLVFSKHHPTTIETQLRVIITDAGSKEEALGKAIVHFGEEPELKHFNLSLKVVLQIENDPS